MDKSQQGKEAFQIIMQNLSSMSAQSLDTFTAITDQVKVTQGMAEHVQRMKDSNESNRNLSINSLERTKNIVENIESLQRLVNQFKKQ